MPVIDDDTEYTQRQDAKQLVDNAIKLNRDSKHVEARRLLETAQEIFERINDDDGLCRAVRIKGDTFYHQRDYVRARLNYEDSLKVATDSGNSIAIANCLKSLGMISFMNDHLDLALRQHRRALILFEDSKCRQGIANTLRTMAQISLRQGDNQTGIKLLKRALKIYKGIGDKLGEGNTYFNMGRAMRRMGNLQSAQDYQLSALSMLKEIDHLPGQANVHAGLAEVALLSDQDELGASHLEAAVRIREDSGSDVHAALHISNCGVILMLANRESKAIPFLKRAMTIYCRLDRENDIQRMEKALKKCGATYI